VPAASRHAPPTNSRSVSTAIGHPSRVVNRGRYELSA
jgi:hypothetical protein